MSLLAKDQPKRQSPAEYEAEKAAYLVEAAAMTTADIEAFMSANKFSDAHATRIMMYSTELRRRTPAKPLSDAEIERYQR